MKIPIYQVDAFTSEVFKGNPAAVCPLDKWLPDKIMQEIAKENNLSETSKTIKQSFIFFLCFIDDRHKCNKLG